ncbi:MAG: M1 family peptidase [Bacteroidetes bacterium]|nr:M1 family peptidase [Bacteroidota bacterium]
MKKTRFILLAFLVSFSTIIAQEEKPKEVQKGHYNISKFKQLNEEFATPNMYRTAAGAPGKNYYQQRADYKIDVVLDDKNQKLFGNETITYYNNSPDVLEYLWVQLEQNRSKPNSLGDAAENGGPSFGYQPQKYVAEFMGKPFQGGFNIESLTDSKGKNLKSTINFTMMRIDLDTPLQPGASFSFNIKWWYHINNYMIDRGRSGYEHFPKDGNNLYIIAQFFPRMAVYNDVEGWQNMQFWGRGEFTLPFGNYDVTITTPSDHILDATGVLQNPKEVFTPTEYNRYIAASTSFDKPIIIVTQAEATEKEKHFSEKTKTWKFKAENVRDFAFSSSRKFIYDMQAVKIGGKTVMAVSLYPKEGNPLWEEYSTKVVAHTLKSYSNRLFDYPYPKAISVNADQQGMEYPMICWNFGRCNEDGTYSPQTRRGMIGVIVHEVGHNFFPMIVNSDERQWTWMDEGLNTFTQLLAQEEFEKDFPSRGYPKNVVEYMSGDQNYITPIMTQSESIFNFSSNAYAKPAAGLYMLREFIMGHELFDHAFKTYANRWKFKHPTPEDFFRTMEDASAVDLDWFWRGWFYTTNVNDIGIKSVKKYYVTDIVPKRIQNMTRSNRGSTSTPPQMVYLVAEDHEDVTEMMINTKNPTEEIKLLDDYLTEHFSKEERAALENPTYFYEVKFEKPGGLVMPILVDYIFEDGSKISHNYPAEVWRLNDHEVIKLIPSTKPIKEIIIDSREITADINKENNYWPKKESISKLQEFKAKQ